MDLQGAMRLTTQTGLVIIASRRQWCAFVIMLEECDSVVVARRGRSRAAHAGGVKTKEHLVKLAKFKLIARWKRQDGCQQETGNG